MKHIKLTIIGHPGIEGTNEIMYVVNFFCYIVLLQHFCKASHSMQVPSKNLLEFYQILLPTETRIKGGYA